MDLQYEIQDIIERIVGIKYIHTGIGSYEEIYGCDDSRINRSTNSGNNE